MSKIAVIGGGLVGSLLAVFFAKRGFQVNVFEKRSDIRDATIQAGRSINLVVADRGWEALRKAGIEEEIRKITVPVYGRMAHDITGKQDFHQYSVEKKAIYSVSRAELNKSLIEIADGFDNVNFHFNCKCTGINDDGSVVNFLNADGEELNVQADVIFGADGANSVIRQDMLVKLDKADPGGTHSCDEETIDHGYKELVIPPAADGSWVLEENSLHIWPRKQYMLMALANLDGGFTCTLFLPFKGKYSFEALETEKDLMSFFNEMFGDAVPIMPSLLEDFFMKPASLLTIVKCDPWVFNDRVVLIGDAAHAIVPFYGEGMNCGFEDCNVLNDLLGEGDVDWPSVLKEYNRERKPNGDAIADLSLRNFVEMRDLVSDPDFIFRKKIEAKLQIEIPDKWLPLYSQVKFTNTPYSEAWAEGLRQDEVMEKILAIPGIEQKWQEEGFAKTVADLL